jgi:hypothetical protein
MKRLAVFLFTWPAFCQTTQGILVGRIIDSVTGQSVPQVSVLVRNEATTAVFPARSDFGGTYAVSSLSPGEYRVTVTAANYQTQQARALLLPVAGRVELNFRLRPLYDVFEANQFRSWLVPGSQQAIGFYGPDVDTTRVAVFNANRGQATPLDSSLSDVISNQTIENLPLLGRDVYELLLLLPGVTSDTATARGLGFSVNGQRPSSSNYLLDGAENNNLLVTGPLSAVVPEFLEEYRISTSNFSAEYGRTSGFLANAITRSGTNDWHGRAFFYLRQDRLNANGFQENAQGIPRPPFTELQPGFFLGGAPKKNRFFLAAGFVGVYSHGQADPQTFALPTASFIAQTDPSSYSGQLLRKYRPYVSPTGPGDIGFATMSPKNSFGREDGLLRLDWNISPTQRFFARGTVDALRQHDLSGSPYPDFPARFRQGSVAVALGLLSRFGARSQNELNLSRTTDVIALDTPHTEVPTLADDDFISQGGGSYNVVLPGSSSAYNYRNRGRNWDLSDNFTRIVGRHTLKVGAGLLARSISLSVPVYPSGYLQFASASDFAQGNIQALETQYDTLSGNQAPLSPQRDYNYKQAYAFVQDSFHVSNHVSLDYGLRYEYFGTPVNAGAVPDLTIALASGANIVESITGATQVLQPPHSPVYTTKPSNWAGRLGGSWSPFENGHTVFRASIGMFYDRLFDNLWENVIQNRFATGIFFFNNNPVNLSLPLAQIQQAGQLVSSTQLIPQLAFQPSLRAPNTNSAFVEVQHNFAPGLSLDVHGLASRSRQLITTDYVNRPYSVPTSDASPIGRLNPDLDYINYRANQGSSNYSALVAALRFRLSRFSGQVSYTWSHSMDNQSEALAGTFFDFNTLQSARAGGSPYRSSFTRQFASSLDWGNSHFDQRQSAVFFFTYQPPGLPVKGRWRSATEGWSISGLGAIRSGLPYTVYAMSDPGGNNPEVLINNRANLIDPAHIYLSQPTAGGVQILNPAAFAPPAQGQIGNTGRNAFTGPGLFNTDISLARSLRLTEFLRVTLRADFYNVFNHANLNNPNSLLGSPDFGTALYGRTEASQGFPLLAPLSESGRQIQLFVRLEF